MTQPDKTIRCWRLGEWPALDQAAWTRGCTPVAPYDDPYGERRAGSTLRPDTLSKISKGYGRWLCFLAARGALEPDQPPLARVTRRRLRAYFHALRTAGNADYTVIGRFDELRKAMRILAPGQDVSWIDKPDGVSIAALLPKLRRPMLVPDSGVLLAWALAMMDQARVKPTAPRRRLTDYRDGLLLAMLAARGRRLRSMSLLRPGREVLQRGGHYRIELTPEQVKTSRADHFGLPEELTPYIQHYLDVVRPALLAGQSDDAFWISRDGTRMTAKAIQTQVFARTGKRFARAFGPHRMRHAIATTAALRASGHPSLGAGVLNITGRTTEKSYNLAAGQTAAALTFAALIEARRRSSRGERRPARRGR
jgi:site-specific recombinase XerC